MSALIGFSTGVVLAAMVDSFWGHQTLVRVLALGWVAIFGAILAAIFRDRSAAAAPENQT